MRHCGIGRNALKGPVGFLLAGNDFHFQTGVALNGGSELAGVDGVARGAGGDDAGRGGSEFAGLGGEGCDGLRGMGDGLGLQVVGGKKPRAEASLFAALQTGSTVLPATSATSSFTEFVPTSMTARRVVGIISGQLLPGLVAIEICTLL